MVFFMEQIVFIIILWKVAVFVTNQLFFKLFFFYWQCSTFFFISSRLYRIKFNYQSVFYDSRNITARFVIFWRSKIKSLEIHMNISWVIFGKTFIPIDLPFENSLKPVHTLTHFLNGKFLHLQNSPSENSPLVKCTSKFNEIFLMISSPIHRINFSLRYLIIF